MNPIIFLDLDGVLNGHEFDAGAKSCTIRPDCVQRFNRILRETNADVILSSAWRYIVSGGAMTLGGFTYMLQTHGVAGLRLIGRTVADEQCLVCCFISPTANIDPVTKAHVCPQCGRSTSTRGNQIIRCVAELVEEGVKWIAMDDLPIPEISQHHLVQTNGDTGLTDHDADVAIALLQGRPRPEPPPAASESDGPIIAVDFDGTIVEHRYPDLGAPVPGAIRWMKEFQQAGAKLILWTMRSDSAAHGPTLTAAVEYLKQQGVELFGVNTNPTQAPWTKSPKAYAQIYIDDAAAMCPLRESARHDGRPYVDWDVVGPAVMQRILA